MGNLRAKMPCILLDDAVKILGMSKEEIDEVLQEFYHPYRYPYCLIFIDDVPHKGMFLRKLPIDFQKKIERYCILEGHWELIHYRFGI